MKLYEIIDLSNLYESIKDYKMPIKTTYKFAMLMQQVQNQTDFYKKEFNKIIEEYGKKENGAYIYTDNGQAIAIIEGKEAECNDKIQELRDLEVEMKDISFQLEELENLNLTLEQLTILMPLIKI